MKTLYACQNCGFSNPKWLGRCPECGTWNSFVEEPRSSSRTSPVVKSSQAPRPLDEIHFDDNSRIPSGCGELDRVLGGGIVPGSVVLLGGDPGIGKTTLLLEVLARLSREKELSVLYCTGEESPRQLKLRAERLGLQSSRFLVYSQNSLDGIIAAAKKYTPDLLVIDSVQTMTSSRLESAAGSVGQVRQVAGEIIPFAKERELPVFLVGHVTKDGNLAGPRVLEHMVDTVLYFEGENSRDYRILRSVKNRFGSTNEIGIFEMTGGGLVEVANPSRLFLQQHDSGLPGSIVAAAMEGTRPLLVEIQALCAPTGFSVPRRTSSGADKSRFVMLTAVIERRVGLSLQDQDIYLNFAGGFRVAEPAMDLGIVTAVCSSFSGKAASPGTVVIGEVGLTGEVRPVSGIEKRLQEAEKLGFERIILPSLNLERIHINNDAIKLVGITQVQEALNEMFL